MKSLLAVLATVALAAPSFAAKCSPTGVCHACTTCSACKHCAKEGGSCSVCRAQSGHPASHVTARPQRLAQTAPRAPRRQGPSILMQGRVVGISDGDTISVLYKGKAEKIRLDGIDAPEKKQPFGERAKQFTSSQAFGKDVMVQVNTIDRYGRNVGVVTLPDGRVLNSELVRNGYAWWYRQYAPDAHLLGDYEQEARKARRGLWGDKAPIAPWAWRKK